MSLAFRLATAFAWGLALLLPQVQSLSAGVSIVADFIPDLHGTAPKPILVLGTDGNSYGVTSGGGFFGKGTVFKITPAGILTTMASFEGTNGEEPQSLLQASDGNFYGVTALGGASQKGTVFRMTPSGDLTTIASLDAITGASLLGNLVQARDGNLYGAANVGGTENSGMVFRVTLAGVVSPLYSFSIGRPSTGLVLGHDGNLYGGWVSSQPFEPLPPDRPPPLLPTEGYYVRIFKLTTSGRMATFSEWLGSEPITLIRVKDGTLYGTTGGGFNAGISIFKINPLGDLTTLVSFKGNLVRPCQLAQGKDGNLYGGLVNPYYISGYSFTEYGQPGDFFKLTPDGVYTIVKSLLPHYWESSPLGPLFRGADGYFYGISFSGSARESRTIFKINPLGDLTSLFDFGKSTGIQPLAGLIEAKDGNFYGTASTGGSFGKGTIYKLTPDGDLVDVASFTGANGATPLAALLLARDGNFYGTTYEGGVTNQGTVFRLTPAGVLTTLVSFNGNNGARPYATLIESTDGNLYGTTVGSYVGSDNEGTRYGTVFKITPAGVLTTLVNFTGPNGANPYGALLQAGDGNFYGTTMNSTIGGGTVFRLTSDGILTTLVLFSEATGDRPFGTLVQGSDGNFYGTTYQSVQQYGNIFRMTPQGVLSGFVQSGVSEPNYDGLVVARDGNFYGYGGSTVFRLSPTGILDKLGTLTQRLSGLVEGSDGYLYGTISTGGSAHAGTILRVSTKPQTITISPIPDQTVGQTPIVLHATASSGLPVTLTSNVGTIVDNVLTVQFAGDGVIYANQAGDEVYGAAPQQTMNFKVNRGTQEIIFPPFKDRLPTTELVPVYAYTTGGSEVIYSVTGPAQFLTDSYYPRYLRLTGSGLVTVTVKAPSNSNYKHPRDVVRTFSAYYSQTITFPSVHSLAFQGPPVALRASASSGLPVTYRVLSGPGSVSGDQLTATGVGVITVEATQVGNDTYPAVGTHVRITATKLSQTVSFPPVPTQTYAGSSVKLRATASSGLPITYSILSGPGTLQGNRLTATGAGVITVQATQAGNDTYQAAGTHIRIRITVKKASQTVSFPQVQGLSYQGSPVTLRATASSGLPITFFILSGPGRVEGNLLTATARGVITVRAQQSGNELYGPAEVHIRITAK